jgi:hypothetical protein
MNPVVVGLLGMDPVLIGLIVVLASFFFFLYLMLRRTFLAFREGYNDD